MKTKNKFNVIIEKGGKYVGYDILPYLESEWKQYPPKKTETLEDWVERTLMYRFWSKCEYEFLLLPWPPSKNDQPEKVDVYWQTQLNMETIIRLFKENIGK